MYVYKASFYLHTCTHTDFNQKVKFVFSTCLLKLKEEEMMGQGFFAQGTTKQAVGDFNGPHALPSIFVNHQIKFANWQLMITNVCVGRDELKIVKKKKMHIIFIEIFHFCFNDHSFESFINTCGKKIVFIFSFFAIFQIRVC